MKKKPNRFSFPREDYSTWREFVTQLKEEEIRKTCERCGCLLPLHQTNSIEYSIYEQRILCDLCAMHESYL